MMFWTVALILLGLGLLGAMVLWRGSEAGSEERAAGALGTGILGLLTAVALWFGCVNIVPAGQVGVPVTFGSVGEAKPSGFHVKPPWQDVETMPVRPFPLDDQEVKARTSQSGLYTVRIGGRWHIIPERAEDTFLQVRTGDEALISDIVERAIATATVDEYVKLDNQTAAVDRTKIRASIIENAQAVMVKYGIAIDEVFIRSVEPDQRTSDANARLAAQKQETAIATEALRTATEQAKANKAQAEGVRDAAATLPNLSPAQAEALCAQAWERQQALATKSGQPMYTAPCGGQSDLALPAK